MKFNFAGKTHYLKIALIVGLIFAGVVILSWPAHTYGHKAADKPFTLEGYTGFSPAEGHPSGYRYAWALQDASLFYVDLPRYAPINVRLRLNLERPAGVPPTRLEIYESGPGAARLLTTLEYEGQNGGNLPRDYYFTVPPKSEGEGLRLELRSNTFKVAGDSRQLGFLFIESEVSLPRTHLRYLFWPNLYWPAALLVLVVLTAWTLRAGFSLVETGLLTSMAGLVMTTMAASSYQHSFWLLLIGLMMAGLCCWEGRQRRWSVWPLMAASSLLAVFFLFSGDPFFDDIAFYIRWATVAREQGIVNIYQATDFDYLPLISYVLWFYGQVAGPLGFLSNPLGWRVVASLVYIATIGLLYQIARRQIQSDARAGRWLVLLAFNAALLHNPVVWGQSDIIGVLLLLLAFHLAYQKQVWWSGIACGLVFISKPQAWFVLPVIAWLLIERCGWRKAIGAGVVGSGVALALAALPFGFDLGAVWRYFNGKEFAGDYANLYPNAFNLNYLVLGTNPVEPPVWLSVLGFGVVGLTLLLICYYQFRHNNRSDAFRQWNLSAGLLAFTCFTWLIKMKERYLIFALPFVALAALHDRRLVKPFLALSWLHLYQLTVSLFMHGRKRSRTLPENFYWWSTFLNEALLKQIVAVGTVGLWAYLAFLYLQTALKPLPRPDEEARPQAQEVLSR